jgi:arginyl-tRNA synthetase
MQIQEKIKKWIEETLGLADGAGDKIVLAHPKDLKNGDYSFFTTPELFAKVSSLDEAVKILNENKLSEIAEIKLAGKFINFYLSKQFFAEVVEEINDKKEKFGYLSAKNETWVIEHTSPNPNKAMHIGHLRNNLTGMAIARIAEANGYEVVCDAIDNDRGIAIAKLMWGYLKFGKKDGEQKTDLKYWYEHQDEWQTPKESKIRPDRFVDDLYVKGSIDFESSPEIEKIIRQLVVDWESEDKIVWELWKKVLRYSHEGQEITLKRLGNRWDFVWHESEHYKMGKDFMAEGLKKNVFKKVEDGAIITDLEKFGLTDTIVQKSDGTSLYITQDIALTKLKLEKYKAQKLFWVIGPEQSLAMQQMFAVCEQLGIGHRTDFNHIPYGYMSIKGQGKISSRKGNAIFIDDLIDEVKVEIVKIIEEKGAQIKNLDETSEMLALGAIKYGTLKMGRMQDTSFDIKEAISFEGDSGPYLQYTAVRANSVLQKSEIRNPKSETIWNKIFKSKNPKTEKVSRLNLDTWETTELERYLYRFPEVVERAGEEYAPHYIVTYLTELASMFNSFYANNRIIDPTPALSEQSESNGSPYKIALTSATSKILHSGLNLLGIKVPERM